MTIIQDLCQCRRKSTWGSGAVSNWIEAEQAAQRLGVKAATLYTYVSRGILTRRKAPDGRSIFSSAEIEELARRGRPRRQAGRTELVIESAVTMLGEDRHNYRGQDAIYLAEYKHPEEVAILLWTGVEPDDRQSVRAFAPVSDAVKVAREAQSGLPPAVLLLERLQLIVTALAVADPVRLNLDPAVVVETGRGLMSGMIAALPHHGRVKTIDSLAMHAQLFWKLASAKADERLTDVLRFIMVLLADHELAASTLAARVAASVRADPYAVVAAGLGVTSGALHGGASLGVESMLTEIKKPDETAYVMGERLRRGERISGFGHAVYRNGDARADALMQKLRMAVPGHRRLAVAEAMIEEAHLRGLPPMNVDFPLGLFTHLAGMPRGAGEAIFGISRTVGWLAHAMEEYKKPTQLRLRAAYTGPTG
ncbi:citrate/2-methylcitrate synthase [Dactylosporangium vinaceum]|uniref:citrate/2-methylcitrate synthase n=1 Tax=Dactylosporangium vinaceum TaxID=53362 RepID=UPI001CA94153|nr:citrate/2-methylcitrate synthase [Dactylosporangium vinaceum]